jgi:hypothetical protein
MMPLALGLSAGAMPGSVRLRSSPFGSAFAVAARPALQLQPQHAAGLDPLLICLPLFSPITGSAPSSLILPSCLARLIGEHN